MGATIQVSGVHLNTNPVNTNVAMANNGKAGRSPSKNNAASDNKFNNYAYGDKAYRLENVGIKYVDRFRNFVIVVDSPVIPKWKEAGELIAVTKYSISPDKMMAKLHQIKGFDAWWDAAKAAADADAAKVATKNFIDAVKGVDDLDAEAMQAILNFNFGIVKPNGTDTLYSRLGEAITVSGILLPITGDEEYIYVDGTKSDASYGLDGYKVVFDFNIKLDEELMK